MVVKIPKDKITVYLLNEFHPDGGSKARFFVHVAGFNIANWEIFESFLIQHFQTSKTISETITMFGTKIVKESRVVSPNGRTFVMRSVWMLEEKTKICNLVTAYPI